VASKAILEKKQKKVEEFKEIIKKDGVYFFDYRGLTVPQFEELRNKIREHNGSCMVLKNSIVAKGFAEENIEIIDDNLLIGPNAIAYVDKEFVEVAKVLADFAKEKDAVEIKAGFVEGKYVDKQKLLEISRLPGRDQLVAQLVMTIAMPIKKFGMTLSSPIKNILILMNNLKDKKEKEAS
jgi:large subunit ribosomal protein L10